MTTPAITTRTRPLADDPASDLVVGRAAFELIGIDVGRPSADPKAPFFSLLDALRAVPATTHLSVWIRWGGDADPRFRAFLLLTVVDGDTVELDAMGRVAAAMFATPRSPWSVRAVDPDALDAPETGEARRLRQVQGEVAFSDGRRVAVPMRFAHPGRDSWDRLIASMRAIPGRTDLVVTATPTVLTPAEERRLELLALGQPPVPTPDDARARATILDVVGSYRTPLFELQILLIGADGLAEVEAGAVAASLSAGFDTQNGDGWRTVASPNRAILGGYVVEPVRNAALAFATVGEGRPLPADTRALEDLVTFDELSYLLCWPIGSDADLPGVPTVRVGQDLGPVATTGADDEVVLGTAVDGTPIGVRGRERTQHLVCLGGSGCGKTTLLTSLAGQDIVAGRTTWVIDSSADTLRRLAALVPSDRLGDVVVLDMEDPDHSHRIDLLDLSADLDLRRRLVDAVHDGLVADVPVEFHGPVGRANLTAVLQAMSACRTPLRRILDVIGDESTAAELANQVGDDSIAATLRFLHLGDGHSVGDMKRWLGSKPAVLAEPAVARVLGAQASAIGIERLLAPGAIVLIRPPHAAGAAHLVTSILLEVLARAILDRSLASPPCSVYLEEIQRAAGRSLRGLMNEARKRNVALHLATQHLGNLGIEGDGVITNAATVVLGRNRGAAARRLEVELGVAEGHLARLANLEFTALVPADGQPVGPFTFRVAAPGPAPEDWPDDLADRLAVGNDDWLHPAVRQVLAVPLLLGKEVS